MIKLLFTFDRHCPEKLCSSLVDSTHAFYTKYVSKPHIIQPSPDTLHQYQLSREDIVALQSCVQSDSWHELTKSINHQTSVGIMWHLINKIAKKKNPSSVLHHSPAQWPQDLIIEWSEQSQITNLPVHIQDALSTRANRRALPLTAALLSPDEEDDVAITEKELRRALARDKASAPLDDDIISAVHRVFLEVPDNPLLKQYNLCFLLGYVPQAWTRIVPIPKPITKITSCLQSFRTYSSLTTTLPATRQTFTMTIRLNAQAKNAPLSHGRLHSSLARQCCGLH